MMTNTYPTYRVNALPHFLNRLLVLLLLGLAILGCGTALAFTAIPTTPALTSATGTSVGGGTPAAPQARRMASRPSVARSAPTITVYSYSAFLTCSGPGTTVSVVDGSIQQIVDAVLAALNSPNAACTNPGYGNNVYSFGRQDGLQLWFNCASFNNCGGQSVDNGSITVTSRTIVLPEIALANASVTTGSSVAVLATVTRDGQAAAGIGVSAVAASPALLGSFSCSGSTNAQGLVSCTYAAPATSSVGQMTETVTASCDGCVTSASASVTVTDPSKFVTTTLSVSASLASTVVGQTITLVASISPSSTTGTVAFMAGASTLGTASLSGGVASLNLSFSTAGQFSISASYAGDSNTQASNAAAVNVTVNGAVTTIPSAPVSATPTTSYGYDAQGNPTTVTQAPDSLALTTSTAYDPLSRPKTVTDPANASTGASTQLGYDGGNRLTTVTDPRSLTTQYQRDGLGQNTQLTSPDTGSASQTYDAAGNLLTRTDSRSVLASHSYDALNRLTAATFSKAGQPNLAYSWAYDQTGGSFTSGIGRLTSMTFPEGSASYGYDRKGRVTQVRQLINPNASANTQAIVQYTSYGYDAAGHVTSLVYPSGRALTIGYANGLPTSLGLAQNAIATAVPLISGLQFAPFGAVQSWNWAMASGPVPHTRVLDSSGRLTRYPMGEHLRDLTYDAAGRITGYTHYLAASGASTGSTAPAQDQQFAYDAAGRLTQATTAQASWTYTYDANGNRTSVAVNSGTPNAYTIASDSNRLNQIATPGISLSYDAMGNTTSDGNFTLAYDLRGRTASLTQGGFVATYSYDNSGQRIRKYSNTGTSSTVVFAYDQNGQLLGEYDSQGNAIREYVWLGSMPVAVFTPDPSQGANAGTAAPLVYYIHADHLNTPRVVVDSSNTMRWRWLSEPFGTTAPETSPAGQAAFTFNLRFPGQYLDAESGIFYNVNRDYVPGVGRYAQSDPIGLAAGVNTYSYTAADPISNSDPSGLFVIPLIRPLLPLIPAACYLSPGCRDLLEPMLSKPPEPEQSWPTFPAPRPIGTPDADKETRDKCFAAYTAQVEVCKMTSATPRAREACYAKAANVYADCLKKGCP